MAGSVVECTRPMTKVKVEKLLKTYTYRGDGADKVVKHVEEVAKRITGSAVVSY